jgi:hypothetical protein
VREHSAVARRVREIPERSSEDFLHRVGWNDPHERGPTVEEMGLVPIDLTA